MAIRPVYVSINNIDYVNKVDVEFEWFSGFAVKQKQKSINSLHKNFIQKYQNNKILEVSSKSNNKLGVNLSAFNLMIETKKGKKTYSVESVFQSSKVFEFGGPYKDIMEKSSRDAKKDNRLKSSGKLVCFEYSNNKWLLEPKTMFYDWIYINALGLDINKHLAEEVIKYDAFTDIEFNPKRSINCQARAVALFVSLHRVGLLNYALKKPSNYVEIINKNKYKQLELI